MPATLSLQTTTAYTNETGGQSSVGPITFTGTITPIRTNATLASGNNSFTVPTGAIGAIIVPPTTNTIVLKVKTTSGDTGINLPLATPAVVLFDTTNLPATLFVNAASLTTGITQVLFF